MSSAIAAIPLEGRHDDHGVVGMGHEVRASIEGAVSGASLSMQEYGLLASPRVALDADRLIEDRIASQVDLSLEVDPPPRQRDRSGGCLRICQARARIMAVLHQVRLTMLIECHPTLDEAVLSAWPGPSGRSHAEAPCPATKTGG